MPRVSRESDAVISPAGSGSSNIMKLLRRAMDACGIAITDERWTYMRLFWATLSAAAASLSAQRVKKLEKSHCAASQTQVYSERRGAGQTSVLQKPKIGVANELVKG